MHKIFNLFSIFTIAFFIMAFVQGSPDMIEGAPGSTLYGDHCTEVYDFDNDITATIDSGHNLGGGADPDYETGNPGVTHQQGTHSADFVADNDYTTLADDPHFDPGAAADYSLAFWVRFKTSAANRGIMFKHDGDGYYFWTDATSKLNMQNDASWACDGSPAVAGTAFTAGTWYHVVIAFDASATNEFTLWISAGSFGSLIDAEPHDMDCDAIANANELYIGYDEYSDTYMNGNLDEFAWFNDYALDAGNAEAMYDKSWGR